MFTQTVQEQQQPFSELFLTDQSGGLFNHYSGRGIKQQLHSYLEVWVRKNNSVVVLIMRQADALFTIPTYISRAGYE